MMVSKFGISYSRLPFSGSMLNFGRVTCVCLVGDVFMDSTVVMFFYFFQSQIRSKSKIKISKF